MAGVEWEGDGANSLADRCAQNNFFAAPALQTQCVGGERREAWWSREEDGEADHVGARPQGLLLCTPMSWPLCLTHRATLCNRMCLDTEGNRGPEKGRGRQHSCRPFLPPPLLTPPCKGVLGEQRPGAGGDQTASSQGGAQGSQLLCLTCSLSCHVLY